MKQEELSIEKLHSYSGWRLDPTKLVDSKLIAAQEALFLVAAVIAQIQTRSEKTSSLDYLFYTVSGALFLLIVSSLLANEKLLKGRLKVGFLGLLSTTLQLALLGILKSTYCLENSTCSFKEATSETVLSNCFSCVRISSSSPPETVRGLQLTYSRSTPILLFALLGFENKPCQLIYSLIPLQVYMVSFPNLSQAEKITGYICLSGNILTCLIKCYSIYGLKRKTSPKILGFATKMRKIDRDDIEAANSTYRKQILDESTPRFSIERTWAPVIEPEPNQVMSRLDVIVNVPQHVSPVAGLATAFEYPPIRIKKLNLRESNGDQLSVSKQTYKKADSNLCEPSQNSVSKSRKKMLTQGNHNIKMLWKEGVGNTDNLSYCKDETKLLYLNVVMASSNWVTLLAKSDTPVLLNTYNEQIHGELANQLRRSLFSANHSLTDDYIDLEALMVDSVKETQFDQVTAINLRLIGEALFKLTEEERTRYNVTPECLHMMNSLLQGMQEIPRDAMQEVNKKLRLHTPLQILKFVNKNIKELKQALSSADDFVQGINPACIMTLLKTIATMLQEMASHSGSLFNKTMPDEHLINKIELKFMWNDGTTMHAQVVNFELEYFVIVQLSGSTESTIQRINAAKAEYVTMMINSLSHEILTPLTEILKNCQSYKLKSRTLGGNTNNTPFHKIYPSLNCLDSSRGASVPIQTRTTGWDHTKLLASSSRRFDKKEFTSKIGGFYNSPTTRQGVSIVESCSKLSPRLASVDILPLTSQIMVHSALSNMDETTAVNTLHLKDFPVEPIKSAGCPLIGSKRASHQLEKALSNMMEDQKGNIEIRQTCSKVGQMSQHESAAINSIEKVTNRIQIFVDGLMAYSQILSNRFELGLLKPVPMAQFLQELCNIFEEKCLLKQVAITLDCSPHLQINSDRKRLACVFLNFLDNSVKFTNQKGSIRVAVELIEPPQLSPDFLLKSDIKGSELDTQFGRSGADHGVLPGASVKFKISDTGIGINKKDMEIIKYSLSNPFHASPTSSSAGIGIGLRISQALISQLSNSLSQMEIVSLVGEGTTISFELPCDGKHIYQDPNREYPEIKLKFADSLDHHQPSKLPVSEPKENNLEPALRNELNESFGGSISEPNGKLLDQFEDTSRIEFPDQFDDTKYTKQQLAVKPNLPPLFNSNPNSRIVRNSSLIEQARTGSARYMVRKAESLMKKAPARRNILSLKCENTRFLARRLGDLKQGPQPSQISKNQYASQVAVSLTNLFGQPDTKKVLVVDDEVFLLEFLREILETLGLEVYTASSPERALEISTTLCNLNKKIDLVYMDFNMPGMNGAQCVKLLRSEQHTRAMEHAWFTALSAQDDKYVRDQFKLVGVSEFMSKPYTFDQIVQHLAQRQLISFDNA